MFDWYLFHDVKMKDKVDLREIGPQNLKMDEIPFRISPGVLTILPVPMPYQMH